MIYDAAIIGAGVTGCAVARELSRWSLKICVIEREEDVCCGTSKANSAIIHAGFDAETDTFKAKYNVEGNARMDALAEELDIPFRRNGALVVALTEADAAHLEKLKARGEANGVKGLRIITGEEARAIEPNLSEAICAALYAPTSGIVCPFEMTQALAENACANGAEFRFNTHVKTLKKTESGWKIETDADVIEARTVINCAGLYADVLHNQVCEDKIRIVPRRGEYLLLDANTHGLVSRTIFQTPGAMGKGVLVTPTVHGNTLVGPTAEDVDNPESTDTTARGLAEAEKTARLSVPKLPSGETITSFAGLRAHLADGGDFRVGMCVDGCFEAAGIESPGLTSAPAIGAYLAELVAKYLRAEPKTDFNPIRRVVRPREMDFAARQKLIAENPMYGNIVCRCEQISEGEIVDAIRRRPGAHSMDGVKRRTRAGMGRCQSGFCAPKTMEILRRELGADFSVTKCGTGSEMEAKVWNDMR